MKVKDKSEKAELMLKLNIQNTNIMASGSITSWQIDWETVETLPGFIFWGSKNTAVTTAIKLKELAPWKKVMINLDS